MPDEPLVDAARLTRALTGPGRVFTHVRCLPTTGSTNADLAAEAVAGAPSGSVLVADHQSTGRGRFDRRWEAPPGTSVAVSVLLRPTDLPLERWLWLPLVTGVAVAEALRVVAGVDALVKWPNDVLIGGKKVCGILSERIESADGALAVVGMGVNVSLTREELPVPTATSLALEGFPLDQSAIVAGVLNHFARWYEAWTVRGNLRAEYVARCASIGADLAVHLDGEPPVLGVGRGVDRYGRLEVATPGGLRVFAVGDVVHARLHS